MTADGAQTRPDAVAGYGYGEWEVAEPDLAALDAAWRRLADRYVWLRTADRPNGGAPRIESIDLTALTPEAATAQAQAIRAEMSARSPSARPGPPSELQVTLLPGKTARLHWWFDTRAVASWSWWHEVVPDFAGLYLGEGVSSDVRISGASAPECSVEPPSAPPDWPPPDWPRTPRTAEALPVLSRSREHGLPAELAAALARGAAASSVTVDDLVTTAFTEVVRAWSTNDEFAIARSVFTMPGTAAAPVARGRPRLGALSAGSGDGRFDQRLRTVAARLEALRDETRPDSATGYGLPVAMTSLLAGHRGGPGPAVGRLLSWRLGAPTDTVHLQVLGDGGELRFRWDWPEELYPAGMLDDIVAAFAGLLRRLADDAACWSDEYFPMLGAAAHEQRTRVNATLTPVAGRLLQSYAFERADSHPDDVAIVTSSRQLTYRELAERAYQVGRALRARGVQPGSVVAMMMDKGWEQWVAVHGILAAGGAFMPIDPAVPEQRLRRLLEHAQAAVLLSQSGLKTTALVPAGVCRLDVDRDFEAISADPLAPVQQPADLAYVISTSGSTGTPKCVMVNHLSAVNTIEYTNRRLGIGPHDRCIAVTAMSFDISVYDLFGLFAAGGSVAVPEACAWPDPAHWATLVEQAGVTLWNSAPALLEILVLHWETSRRRESAPTLRTVILGGDFIPLSLPGRLRAILNRVAIYNVGGPAETCIWSSMYQIGDVDAAWSSIPYGKPIANQQIHVLDQRHRPCPVWVPGELYVASQVALAQGYLHDEAMTAERFVALPGLAERAYATGDIGRYLPDGNLELLGRADFQVKIQGVRIELGEIETCLRSSPSVATAVVVCDEHKMLRAYVTRKQDAGIPRALDSDRHAFLAARLPAYMVPATIVELDALPLNRNGKVDRLALSRGQAAPPSPARDARPGTADGPQAMADHPGYQQVVAEVERVLGALWQEVLDVGTTQPQDNFFDLGGHSLSLVRLVYRIADSFGLDVELSRLLDYPELSSMAGAITAELVGRQAGAAALILDEVAMLPDTEVEFLLGDG